MRAIRSKITSYLEKQSRHLAINCNAVKHLDDTMVCEVGVLSVALEELREGRTNITRGEALHEPFEVERLKFSIYCKGEAFLLLVLGLPQ